MRVGCIGDGGGGTVSGIGASGGWARTDFVVAC